MLVSHKHKFVCMVAPKAGSSTMKFVLTEQFEAFIVASPTFNFGDPVHFAGLPEEIKDYFVFAVVRNPFSLHYSRYNFFHPRAIECQKLGIDSRQIGVAAHYIKSWDEYLENYTFGLFNYFNHEPSKGFVKYQAKYLKIENIEEEFNQLPFVKNKIKIPYVNVSNKSGDHFYTKEMIEFVVKKFHKDFEAFGYEKKCPIIYQQPIKIMA